MSSVGPLEGSPQALAGDLGPHCCQSAGLEGDGHRHEQRGFRVGFARSRDRSGLPSASRGWLSGLTRGLAGLTRLAQGKRHSWRSSRCEPARGTVGRLVPRAARGAGLSARASLGCRSGPSRSTSCSRTATRARATGRSRRCSKRTNAAARHGLPLSVTHSLRMGQILMKIHRQVVGTDRLETGSGAARCCEVPW